MKSNKENFTDLTQFDLDEDGNTMADAKTMNKVIGGEEFETTEPTFRSLFGSIFQIGKNKATREARGLWHRFIKD